MIFHEILWKHKFLIIGIFFALMFIGASLDYQNQQDNIENNKNLEKIIHIRINYTYPELKELNRSCYIVEDNKFIEVPYKNFNGGNE